MSLIRLFSLLLSSFFLLTASLESARADISVCFVQASNGVPVPCPVDSSNNQMAGTPVINQNLPVIQTLTTVGPSTVTSSDQTNTYANGVNVIFDITNFSGVGTAVLTIQGKDAVSGKYYPILVSAALATTGTTVMTVYPGNAIVANLSSSTPLPATWRTSITVVGVGSTVTATVGATLLK